MSNNTKKPAQISFRKMAQLPAVTDARLREANVSDEGRRVVTEVQTAMEKLREVWALCENCRQLRGIQPHILEIFRESQEIQRNVMENHGVSFPPHLVRYLRNQKFKIGDNGDAKEETPAAGSGPDIIEFDYETID